MGEFASLLFEFLEYFILGALTLFWAGAFWPSTAGLFRAIVDSCIPTAVGGARGAEAKILPNRVVHAVGFVSISLLVGVLLSAASFWVFHDAHIRVIHATAREIRRPAHQREGIHPDVSFYTSTVGLGELTPDHHNTFYESAKFDNQWLVLHRESYNHLQSSSVLKQIRILRGVALLCLATIPLLILTRVVLWARFRDREQARRLGMGLAACVVLGLVYLGCMKSYWYIEARWHLDAWSFEVEPEKKIRLPKP